jgi:tryptophanyl-tRNA synthetase
MSKSAGNVISLSDDSETVKKKVMSMYTDPARVHGDEPGETKNNPVFVYLRAFGPECGIVNCESKIKDYEKRYQKGSVKDVEVKEFLVEVLKGFLNPVRQRRKELENQPGLVKKILAEGTEKARGEARETLDIVRSAMKIVYF